jgi:hypothetical protein
MISPNRLTDHCLSYFAASIVLPAQLLTASPLLTSPLPSARNAAQIILELIQSERIVPQESTTLSQIYSSNPAPNLAETESGSGGSRGEMLIAPEGIETIVTKEELGSVGTEELTRSLGQVRSSFLSSYSSEFN